MNLGQTQNLRHSLWEAFLNGQSDKKLEPKLLGHDG